MLRKLHKVSLAFSLYNGDYNLLNYYIVYLMFSVNILIK